SGYDSSSDDASEEVGPEAKKRKRQEAAPPKTLEWPMEWVWLMTRTQRHADFRPPQVGTDSKWATEPTASSASTEDPPLAVAISTSLVYVGDGQNGYDPRHLGRVVVVDQSGRVLLDAHVQPRSKLLDTRPHLTGLCPEALDVGTGALDFDEVRARLLTILRPRTVLVGHRLNSDME
ncbi:unnamed protein product, partial [Polarella glacialis]